MNRKDFVHRSISLDNGGEVSVSITRTTLALTHEIAIYRKNKPQDGEESPDKWTQVLRMSRVAARDLARLLDALDSEGCDLELREPERFNG